VGFAPEVGWAFFHRFLSGFRGSVATLPSRRWLGGRSRLWTWRPRGFLVNGQARGRGWLFRAGGLVVGRERLWKVLLRLPKLAS